MKRASKVWLCSAFLFGISAAGLPNVWGENVQVILSSKLEPYQAALAGYQERLGRPPAVHYLSDKTMTFSGDTRAVVAIGGKAALQVYPDNITVIYTMVPGLVLKRSEGRSLQVPPLLPPSVLLVKFKELQPSLKRLAIFWNSEFSALYLKELEKLAPEAGLQLIAVHLPNAADLPSRLRSLSEKPDAIWLTPDPLIVNQGTFAVLKEYSQSKRIPFYAPTGVLVGLGATASIGTSFSEMGKTTAVAVQRVLSGDTTLTVLYPEKAEIVLNKTALAQLGLIVSPQMMQRADKIIP